jgi:alkanesulfonate monooxygenase SsuD/methylene tetrahydromethanopterin reductase-like flavin-dependent oxidoreductase (luciferase family)
MIEGQEGVTWEQWVGLARAAEEAELDAMFRSDHYLSILRGGDAGSLDAWTSLAGLAAVTTRLRLGTLVSPVTFRPASVLAKSVVTVDHISGGRAELGIGAGWYEAEHEAYGFPFPPLGERMSELERQLETIVGQWAEAENVWPKPVQQPRPTLLIGGSAKPRTVRAAVHWADEYNTTFATPEVARERRDAVRRACEEAGRAPLRFSLMTTCVLGADEREYERRRARVQELTGQDVGPHMVTGTVEQAAERLREYDLDRVMLQHLAHEDVEMVALLGELQQHVA